MPKKKENEKLWAQGVNGDFTNCAKWERKSHWTATPYDDPWVPLREHPKPNNTNINLNQTNPNF